MIRQGVQVAHYPNAITLKPGFSRTRAFFMPAIKDENSMSILKKTRESTTLQLLLLPMGLVCWKYLDSDTQSATEFAQAISMLLAIWIARETKERYFENKNVNSD